MHCEAVITKKPTCSRKAWRERVKYCSKPCMDATRTGKPSVSPTTTFKKGNSLWETDTRKKRVGQENNMWKGGQVEKECLVCSDSFKVDPYRMETAKFCSRRCKTAHDKSEESRQLMSEIMHQRVEQGIHNMYRGVTKLQQILRHCSQYRQWRIAVYKRDDYTCQTCGVRGGKLNADHITQFALILFQNSVQSYEDAMKCMELWDVSNGRTLCAPCHRKTDTYAKPLKVII